MDGLFYRMERERCCDFDRRGRCDIEIERLARRELLEELPGEYREYETKVIDFEGRARLVMYICGLRFEHGIAKAYVNVQVSDYLGAGDYWLNQFRRSIPYDTDTINNFIEGVRLFSYGRPDCFYLHMFRRDSWMEPGIMAIMRENERERVANV